MRSKFRWATLLTLLMLSYAIPKPSRAVDLNNIRPAQDTYIQQNTATTPYGGNGYVWLGDMGNTSCANCSAAVLLQYDISSIPHNATVTTVTLSFQRSAPVGANTMSISLRQPVGAWNEATATWNLVSLGGIVGTATFDTNPAFPTITDGTLKTIVAGWVADPSTNKGLALVPDTSVSSAVSFFSKENNQGNPALLSVKYSLPPMIDVTPTSINFGPVEVGMPVDRSFIVKNTGGGILSGNATTGGVPFSVVSGGAYSLTAGNGQPVTVRFTPTAAQDYSDILSFTGGGGAGALLLGSGTTSPSPILSFSPSSLSFGSVAVGATSDLSFTVQNTGGSTLVGSASVPAPFSVVSGSPYSLTAGQSVHLFVRFAPTLAQTSTTTVTFTGAGGATASVSGTGSTIPGPDPSWLRVTTASQTQLNLQWDDNSANEDGFKIESKLGCCGPWMEIATLPANSTIYQNSGLTCGTSYAYRVWAFNAAGVSGKSNEASSTTSACSATTVPTPDPSWLRVSAASPTQINLQWDDNSANEDGFKVERKAGCCGPWTEVATLPANTTTYQSSGLTCGGTYAYRVWAFNTAGVSAKTNEAATTTPGC